MQRSGMEQHISLFFTKHYWVYSTFTTAVKSTAISKRTFSWTATATCSYRFWSLRMIGQCRVAKGKEPGNVCWYTLLVSSGSCKEQVHGYDYRRICKVSVLALELTPGIHRTKVSAGKVAHTDHSGRKIHRLRTLTMMMTMVITTMTCWCR
jgi:hypothetical protein